MASPMKCRMNGAAQVRLVDAALDGNLQDAGWMGSSGSGFCMQHLLACAAFARVLAGCRMNGQLRWRLGYASLASGRSSDISFWQGCRRSEQLRGRLASRSGAND
jgi:hypothetical protein